VPTTPFVILFPGRTGSSWLVSCLDSHPQVLAEGERLVGRGRWSQQLWIRGLYRRARRAGLAAGGFKTKLKDVRHLEGFRRLLVAREVRVLIMDRRNVVKLAVSTINARRLHEATGRWNRRPEDPVLPPFVLAPEDLRRVIAECEARQEQLRTFAETLPLPSMTLQYEDLLAAPAETMAGVLSFLDVPPAPLAGSVAKNTDDDLSRVILNVDELRAEFAGGPYADMF
jgi:LPS sulfotransferase NodH